MSGLREAARVIGWRRIDMAGMELLHMRIGPDGIEADASVLCAWKGGFSLDHSWKLTPEWRTRSLRIERRDSDGRRTLTLEREGDGWLVDGARRADLDGTDDPDLSITPFCNTLVLRRVPPAEGARISVETAYVDAETMEVTRSRQRYDRKGPTRIRYIDQGVAAGFEADLEVDSEGLVIQYEHLFERVEVGA
jgi:uncharacterized protein